MARIKTGETERICEGCKRDLMKTDHAKRCPVDPTNRKNWPVCQDCGEGLIKKRSLKPVGDGFVCVDCLIDGYLAHRAAATP